ncbi:hypothetical protein QBC37DRAFT_376667 [Rhypophila decipiens]|uniref:Uncharacterized protein n=1 Tax=Rhypophila decipiens TaxID=261697 RepID=A0AAN7B599_9PEZI|nr:hypothetical protein QBC37DRAFT_376667 [Rhypophila decipiens]
MGNCCPGTSSSSSYTSGSSYYDIPRHPTRNEYQAGDRTRYSRRHAQEDVINAPAPTHNRFNNARRPHAHYDTEGDYIQESIGLTPLPGTTRGYGLAPMPSSVRPVLWSYPSRHANFDYADQNGRGRRLNNAQPQQDPGAFRVISDRHQNPQGVSYHPPGQSQSFARARHRRHRSR